ncbi:PrpF protein [Desarmillaria tabescens]|uniref:PrpF protein n=1 Tax=Armillaria tabescens TaxID=1929756 RepID=A0AA39JQB5_ARMTA|nr:PrpF protein [Desarmillaria tabescens]KAK0446976.1 PrpF protein [Desarmillaria tabescens]
MFSAVRGLRSSTRPFSSTGRTTETPNPLPATFLRGGTSKGIFINRDHLPADRSAWDRIFLGIMGSPDPVHGRQLNGMGGGVSSLSKICVVGTPSPSQRSQGIRDTSIDYSGNCGNLSSMIGAYALDEGICRDPATTLDGSRITIRSLNTNTQKIIDTTFPVNDALVPVLDLPETSIAGVPGNASQIIMDFVNPGGARTGKLLPTGDPINSLTAPNVSASLVDATNPTVFVRSDELASFLPLSDYLRELLESIRQSGAVKMGLDPHAQAQPKIAILSAPSTDDDHAQSVDVVVHALSMGVLHKAVPMTVGLCLGVAANIPGTIAWDIVSEARKIRQGDGKLVRIRHPSGTVDVGAEILPDGHVKSPKVVRTGRRLMKGVVWW